MFLVHQYLCAISSATHKPISVVPCPTATTLDYNALPLSTRLKRVDVSYFESAWKGNGVAHNRAATSCSATSAPNLKLTYDRLGMT